jgi:hypothetical protein
LITRGVKGRIHIAGKRTGTGREELASRP